MDRLLKRVFVVLFIFAASPCAFAADNGADSQEFDWSPVMDAIIEVESEGDPNAVSGNSCGAMQITPILVKECNEILKRRNSDKRYKLSDRFDVAKSREMFVLMQSYYNPGNNIEKAIRSWKGGIRYSVKGTQRYLNKVMKIMRLAK